MNQCVFLALCVVVASVPVAVCQNATLPQGAILGSIAVQLVGATPQTAPRNVPYFALSVGGAFRDLTPKQRLYAHHLSMASWFGAQICAQQISPESLPAMHLFHKLLSHNTMNDLRGMSGVDSEEVDKFFEYVALVYSNMGNYLSAGDTKFVPACSRESFLSIIEHAPVAGSPTEKGSGGAG